MQTKLKLSQQGNFDVVNLYPSGSNKVNATTVLIDALINDIEQMKNYKKLTLNDIHKLIELCLKYVISSMKTEYYH